MATAFVLDLQFVELNPPPIGRRGAAVLVGTSHGVYVGTMQSQRRESVVAEAASRGRERARKGGEGGGGGSGGGGGGGQHLGGDGCNLWTFELSNKGLESVNSTVSMQTDGEEFAHPVAALHVSTTHGVVLAAIGTAKGRGPARPRGGDPFSVYMSPTLTAVASDIHSVGVAHTDGVAACATGLTGLNWTGILSYTSAPIDIFSFAATSDGWLLVGTDQGLLATRLDDAHVVHNGSLGGVWYELGVSPILVSVDRGRHWHPCSGSGPSACPFGGKSGISRGLVSPPSPSSCDALPLPPSPLVNHTAPSCLPVTTQANRTHPNVRTVIAVDRPTDTSGARNSSSSSGGSTDPLIFVTLWDEGWFDCAGGTFADPNLTRFRGGPWVSADGGLSFRSLFAQPTPFPNASLRCAGQPATYLSSNWPQMAVDPTDPGHVLLAGWGAGGQGLHEWRGAMEGVDLATRPSLATAAVFASESTSVLTGTAQTSTDTDASLRFKPGWTRWATCGGDEGNWDCFDGSRVDTFALDSNQ
jgi:hypothetical protein